MGRASGAQPSNAAKTLKISWGCSKIKGCLDGGPQNKDHSILGSVLRVPLFVQIIRCDFKELTKPSGRAGESYVEALWPWSLYRQPWGDFSKLGYTLETFGGPLGWPLRIPKFQILKKGKLGT